MRYKGVFLFWTDVINSILIVGLIATGSILKWVLPPGSGDGQHGAGRGFRGGRGPAATFWDWTRHDGGNVHFWIAMALLVAIATHLLLHFGWIKAAIENWNTQLPSDGRTDSYEFDSEYLASFLTHLAQESPDLAELVKAWPNLPTAFRAGNVAMIRAAVPTEGARRWAAQR